MRLIRALLLLICAMQIAAFQAPQATAPAPTDKVSIIQIIANPAAFDGKNVRFVGWARLEFEESAIFLDESSYQNSAFKNGVWIHVPLEMTSVEKSQLGGSYLIVEGIFRANDKGHTGAYSGAVTNVRLLEKVLTRAEFERKYLRSTSINWTLSVGVAIALSLSVAGWLAIRTRNRRRSGSP